MLEVLMKIAEKQYFILNTWRYERMLNERYKSITFSNIEERREM
jgi:hypothetical protein